MVKNKKGISVILGYVLLVGLAVVIGGIMYSWMKTYVPGDSLDCPDGTSMTIKTYSYSCATPNSITFTFLNNGRFDIAGYYIRVGNVSGGMPFIDLSKNASAIPGEVTPGFLKTVLLSDANSNNNSFKTGEEIQNTFTWNNHGQIYKVEIIPARWQKDKNNRLRYVGCGVDASHEETLACT
jgi:hypothetical protein